LSSNAAQERVVARVSRKYCETFAKIFLGTPLFRDAKKSCKLVFFTTKIVFFETNRTFFQENHTFSFFFA